MFEKFGPYHVARMKGAMRFAEILAIESAPHSGTYDWNRPDMPPELRAVALTSKAGEERDVSFLEHRIDEVLTAFRPDVVALSGWAFLADLVALKFCRKNGIPAICMSETNPWDFVRHPALEKAKKGIVAHFSAGIATSRSQMAYLIGLGLPEEAVFSGYNVIDNEFFRSAASRWRSSSSFAPEPARDLPANSRGRYFLASSRFVPKKNLLRLLEAYSIFRASRDEDPSDWPLVILGDGEQGAEVESKISQLGIGPYVHLPGFLQVEALPQYYGTAGAFIHASTTEQWGLVINEAMAAGLPVAASNRCGATEYLIETGVSGFAFDPYSVHEIAETMTKLAAFERPGELIDAALQSVDRLRPETFGRALVFAGLVAQEKPAIPGRISAAMLDLAIAVRARKASWKPTDCL
ncbi:glycosyltransferase [Novosphingobium aquae]|uniref:Glycosyltransferase n=1 Tax=Novosphingobium aquae TaxID=3133435 RepID=A0ABU8SDW9_9SPHN